MAEENIGFTPIETAEAFEAAVEARVEAARQEERDKFADYEEIKNQLSAANDTNTAQAAEITRLKADSMKQRIAVEVGLPLEMASRLIGDDEKAIRADADGLMKTIKPKRPAPQMRDPDADNKPSKNNAFKRLLAELKND